MDMLRPAGDFCRDAGGGKLALERRLDLFDILLAVEAAFVEELGDLLVGLGLECPQTEILQLPFELPHAEPVGQRREQVLCFARGLRARLAFVRNQVAQRLRSLRELDQHHANVADHRQQHLAQAFRMRVTVMRGSVFRDRSDRTHACDTTDQLYHFRTKAHAERLGVKVVDMRRTDHYRGANRIEIELEAGDDRRGAERAIQPWLAVGCAPIAVERSCGT